MKWLKMVDLRILLVGLLSALYQPCDQHGYYSDWRPLLTIKENDLDPWAWSNTGVTL